MSPVEAKTIIEALANGTDPVTGEVFRGNSPLVYPQTIRALFLAVKALESMARRESRMSNLPQNAGQAWSDTEDKELLTEFDSGMSTKEIATKHSRTAGAIASRLVRLGRIKDRFEALSTK